MASLCLAGLVLICALALPSCMSGARGSAPAVFTIPSPLARTERASPATQATLKLMTLNVAHGRKRGPNQIFQKTARIQSNLDDIARLLRREAPDIVALQEADGPSAWSGRFNHVRYLAEKSGFRYGMRGEHVKGMKISYGTALLSMLPLGGAYSMTFVPSPPTFSKGFVVCTIPWPGNPDVKVDVASVHLDFSRRSVRRKQVEELAGALAQRRRPRVVMGDFNCGWTSKEPTLRRLAETLNLIPYRPSAPDLDTFPRLQKRLDWILISPELEFLSYTVMPDIVSDHLGVVAEIGMAVATR